MISHAHVLCIIYLFWCFPSTCYLRFEKDERYRSRAYQRVAVIREFLYPQTLNIYTRTCNKIFQAVIKTPSIGSGRFIIVAPFSPGQVFNRSRSSHFHLVHINSPNIRYKSAQNNHSQSVKLPLYCFTPTVSRIEGGSIDFITFRFSRRCVTPRYYFFLSQLSQLSKPFYSS